MHTNQGNFCGHRHAQRGEHDVHYARTTSIAFRYPSFTMTVN